MEIVEHIVIFFAILIHSIGLFILCAHRRKYPDKIQHAFLFNLSLLELLESLAYFFSDTVFIRIGNQLNESILIFDYIGLTCVFYAVMTSLTMNRFFEIYLNIKYPLYWNLKKTQFLMVTVWGFSFIMGITFVATHKKSDKVWETSINIHFVGDIFLITIIAITYVYIFIKLKQGKRTILANARENPRQKKRK